jgi:LmbE family N-acetylglucosaminyl deacetylase
MAIRRSALVAAVCALAVALGLATAYGVAHAATACTAGGTLNIVAHEDDDLLFQNPDVLHDIQAGRCVRTVYVTAGDANDTATYWAGREAGVQAAYAQMSGLANTWTTADAGVAGHPVPVRTLAGRPQVSLAFLRLPDGQMDGSGGSRNNFASLQKLQTGSLASIGAVDGSSQYTKADLVTTLVTLMTGFAPTRINTLDYAGSYGDGDHSDHHAVAYLVREAEARYTAPHTLNGYQGYGITSRPENVSGTDLTTKRTAFLTYARSDPKTCGSAQACFGHPEEQWWPRQYTVGATTQPAPTGNVAPSAVATASSENATDGQTAAKAIDGVVDGYPGDYTREWATQAGKAGSWLNLAWNTPVTVDRVVLHDRPNGDDNITAGTLTFADGTTVSVGALDPTGAATTVSFPARSTTSVRFAATAISSTTHNVGLAELEVRTPDGSTPTTTAAPTTTAVPTTTPTTTTPTTSTPTTTTTTGTGGTNAATSAVATASSQNAADGQTAAKAIDGIADGYPGDHTREWATQAGKAGSWLNLAWTTPVTVSHVVLHDRPNSDDNITAGTLSFSDGTTVSVGALDPTGAATTVDFPARSTTSVRFTVTAVSSGTLNVGLAEIEVRTP